MCIRDRLLHRRLKCAYTVCVIVTLYFLLSLYEMWPDLRSCFFFLRYPPDTTRLLRLLLCDSSRAHHLSELTAQGHPLMLRDFLGTGTLLRLLWDIRFLLRGLFLASFCFASEKNSSSMFFYRGNGKTNGDNYGKAVWLGTSAWGFDPCLVV